MASTIELQRTITRTSQFLRLQPLLFQKNTANDPAFSNADWVKQLILSPPFAWRWNRTAATFTDPTFVTIIGQTDYVVNLPTFGWIEKAVAYEPVNGYLTHELQVGLIFGADAQTNQPARISAQFDDGEGNITFRIFPAPDQVYNIVVEYQNSASLFTSVDQTWEPIPDYLSFIYNSGFDAKGYEYTNDPRYMTTMQLFLQQLVDSSENLSQTQKNLWIEDKLNSLRQTEMVQKGTR